MAWVACAWIDRLRRLRPRAKVQASATPAAHRDQRGEIRTRVSPTSHGRAGDEIRTLRCVTSDKPTADLHRVHAGRRTCTADRACPDSTDCSTATPPCSQAGTSWDWPRRRLRERDRRRTRLRSDRCCYTSTWFARARRIGCKHRPTQGSEPSSFFQARETCMNCVASGAAVHPTLVGSPSHPSAPGR